MPQHVWVQLADTGLLADFLYLTVQAHVDEFVAAFAQKKWLSGFCAFSMEFDESLQPLCRLRTDFDRASNIALTVANPDGIFAVSSRKIGDA